MPASRGCPSSALAARRLHRRVRRDASRWIALSFTGVPTVLRGALPAAIAFA